FPSSSSLITRSTRFQTLRARVRFAFTFKLLWIVIALSVSRLPSLRRRRRVVADLRVLEGSAQAGHLRQQRHQGRVVRARRTADAQHVLPRLLVDRHRLHPVAELVDLGVESAVQLLLLALEQLLAQLLEILAALLLAQLHARDDDPVLPLLLGRLGRRL